MGEVIEIFDAACRKRGLWPRGSIIFFNRLGKPIAERTWKYHKAKEAPVSLTLQQRDTIQWHMKETNDLAKACCSWDTLTNVRFDIDRLVELLRTDCPLLHQILEAMVLDQCSSGCKRRTTDTHL